MATGKSGGLNNGYPWLSAVPSAWKARKISSMCYIHGRIGFKGYSRQDLVSNETPGAAVVFGGTNIEKNGTLDYEVLSFLSPQKYLESPEIALNGGEILMTKVGAGVGDCAIYDGRFERATINPNVLIIEPKSPDISADFLRYRLISSDAQLEIRRESTKAGAQPAINQAYVKRLRVSIPVLAEQQFIVEFLNRKTAEIDSLIEKLSLQVGLLEQYRRELIAHTVTHGLDPDVPMRDSGIDWIGMIPSHWKTASISTITDENKVKNSDLSEKNLLSLSYGKIIRKDIDLAIGLLPASFDAYQVLENGYIVLRMTDLQNDKRSLRSAIAKEKGIITGAYIGLKTRSSINPDYLAWLLRFYDLAKVFYSLGGGVRQSANYKEIGKIVALVPPLEAQEQIAIFLETKTTEIDSTTSNVSKQIELLGKYRKQVISDAVTGKVRVEGTE